ncbi:hypothetical protein D9757_010387 [Collybiopsis confluens]|uniref:H-type lectin domain-containing protein n=1 Tax=Collybiopsis confluens TaxID=2823264 RepID=A0A8H5GUX7_9AGAR|nr:hypothetical protein D9757_010387 [Collybiopsis confluens]
MYSNKRLRSILAVSDPFSHKFVLLAHYCPISVTSHQTMPPPSSGDYYITNAGSEFFLFSRSANDQPGSNVFLKKPTGVLGGEFSFNLRKQDGDLYIIRSNLSGLKIGVKESPALVWSTGLQSFQILAVGPGVFSIRSTYPLRFWRDYDGGKLERPLTLSKNTYKDENNFFFIAAATSSSSSQGSDSDDENGDGSGGTDDGPSVPARLDTGIFSTSSIRSWQHPALDNRTTTKFAGGPLAQAPKIIAGLNSLDFGYTANLRIKTMIEEITKESFTINLQSWTNTINYMSSAAWLRVPSEDHELQCGTFTTMEKTHWTQPQKQCVQKIHFPYLYASAPNVVVFLTSLDVERTANVRVRIYANYVQPDSFTINIESWGDSTLWMAGISWFAYPKSEKGICSGTFSTNDVRPWNNPQNLNSKQISFPNSGFEKPPNVFMGLNELDIERGANPRVRIESKNVTKKGMDWHIDTWAETTMWAAGASYMAFS